MFKIKKTIFLLSMILPQAVSFSIAQQDFFYVPKGIKGQAPALIITSCTGATKKDLDSNRAIADKLGWVICTSAKTKNHRDSRQNDRDIMETYRTLVTQYPVDTSKIFIYGFSGQAVQAMMEVFLHPDKFKGAVCICAHDGALGLPEWGSLKGHFFYLISREKDWNLEANWKMHWKFLAHDVKDTLIVTKGEHGPKTRRELFDGCRWLKDKIKK
jgi:dienelactone hydrolase